MSDNESFKLTNNSEMSNCHTKYSQYPDANIKMFDYIII